jgi:hypothetical protein
VTAPADTPEPENTPPHVWWSPFVGLLVTVQGGRARFLDVTQHDAVALPEDAVQLVAVGIPHSAVPGGAALIGGAAFVARQRALHTRPGDDPWCSCGVGHCGMRVLLDHLDHAETRNAAALAELLRGGQLATDVRRAAIAALQGTAPAPTPVELRAAAATGGPCETCGRPRNVHVCVGCADLTVGPDRIQPGPGCGNCRSTGMDQSPCYPPGEGPR